jgi:hypothetical protein
MDVEIKYCKPLLISHGSVFRSGRTSVTDTDLISLTQGKVALVDSDDLGHIAPYRWTAIRSRNTWYAKAHVGKQTIYMHRLIKLGSDGLTAKCKVDHHNGNGLDNRRHNLRAATHAQNMMNSVGRPDVRKSGFKGVSVRKHACKPFRACIEAQGKQKHLGYFASEVEAARAYDDAAILCFGSYARLNFPERQKLGRAA